MEFCRPQKLVKWRRYFQWPFYAMQCQQFCLLKNLSLLWTLLSDFFLWQLKKKPVNLQKLQSHFCSCYSQYSCWISFFKCEFDLILKWVYCAVIISHQTLLNRCANQIHIWQFDGNATSCYHLQWHSLLVLA